jgi:hypothetical protein
MSRRLAPADEMMTVPWSVKMKQRIGVADLTHVPSVELRHSSARRRLRATRASHSQLCGFRL